MSLKQFMIDKFNSILYDSRGNECYGNGYNYAHPHPYLITMVGMSSKPEPKFHMRFQYYGPGNGSTYVSLTAQELKERFPEQLEEYYESIETQEELDAFNKLFE